MKKQLLLSWLLILTVVLAVKSQKPASENIPAKDYNSISCESLRDLLTELTAKNNTILEKNVGVTNSGRPSYTVIIVSPGSKKNSNAKTARGIIYGISSYSNQLGGGLRPVIVETKKVKGLGRFQIYFFDSVYDFAFDESTFECP